MSKKAVVIGAGIAGMAITNQLVQKGYNVTIYERSPKTMGASVRNFGMIWPIGQPSGANYACALRSKIIWQSLAEKARFHYNPCGSLHTAYAKDEWAVLQELDQQFSEEGRDVILLTAQQVAERFPMVIQNNLYGALFSTEEVIVDPREAIRQLNAYYGEHPMVNIKYNAIIYSDANHQLFDGANKIEADVLYICSGADVNLLFPSFFASQPIELCKLQMMRLKSVSDTQIGTAVCGGLSLLHYKSFLKAASLSSLRSRLQEEMPEYLNNGIHVMVSQQNTGELTVGDTHHYGSDITPFDSAYLNDLILDYLRKMVYINDCALIETWNGVYPKLTNGASCIFEEIQPGTFIFNGLGGTGMTMSFALAEQFLKNC